VPELPEVETARKLIADEALHRLIVGVDDADTFVCRPHSPGELRDALTGRTLTAAHRRGKTMWIETSGVGGSTQPGPDLGLHLGMGGRIVVTSKGGDAAEGSVHSNIVMIVIPEVDAERWTTAAGAGFRS